MSSLAPDADRWLTEREAGALLGLSIETLRKWRAKRVGPPFSRFGGKAIRYRSSEVMLWAESQRQGTPATGTAEAVACATPRHSFAG